MSDEVVRFHEGEQTMGRIYVFLALFLWPLSYLVLRVLIWVATSMVGLDLPGWALGLVAWLGIAFLLYEVVRHRQRLRALAAWRAAVYGVGATLQDERQHAADMLAVHGTSEQPVPAPMRLLRSIARTVFVAAHVTAKAMQAITTRLGWDESAVIRAQAVFETLGRHGDAWTAVADHAADAAVLPGLEWMGLIEHRQQAGRAEVRLNPDMRRRYFPKDAAALAPAPMRRR